MQRGVRLGAIAVGVLFVGGVILPRVANVNSFRPKLESELSAALGREVKIADLSLSVFTGTVSADNISIADDPAFRKGPFITAKSFKAGVEITPLLFRKTLHITGITLGEPEITLLRDPGGTWNFSSLGGRSAPAAPAAEPSGKALVVDKLNVDNGRLLVGAANSADKPEVYDKVNFEATDFSATTQFPFKLTAEVPGGGEFSLKGKCGPMRAGNAGATPFDASIAVSKLDLLASGFVPASTGIQGLVDFEGTMGSNGEQVKASGTLKADKWKLAAKGAPSKRAVAVQYAVDYDLKTDAGTVTQGDMAIGKAVARLGGTYQKQGQTTKFNMKIGGNDMPVDELEAALPALGVVLPSGSKLQGGAISVDLAIAGESGSLSITGPVRLSNATLAGFDTSSKLSAIPGVGGKQSGSKDTKIQNCSTTVRMASDNVQADAINVNIPSLGVVTGGGSINPSGALNFAMNADLSGERSGGDGRVVPFSIEGTASDPKFVPNVKALAGGAARQAISDKAGVTKEGGRVGRRR